MRNPKKVHFEKCSVCPVAAELDCFAQVTGAAHAYCRRIKAGDGQSAALVLDLSAPEADPDPVSEPESNSEDEEPAPAPAAQALRSAKPRMALGVPQKAPADCLPCQQRAAAESNARFESAGVA